MTYRSMIFTTVFSISSLLACSGGTSSSGDPDGGASSSGSSGASSNVDPNAPCTEWKPGHTNGSTLATSRETQVAAQSAGLMAGISGREVADLTKDCKSIVDGLVSGFSTTKSDSLEELAETCARAVAEIGIAKAKAGGTFNVTLPVPISMSDGDDMTECQGRCLGAKCDADANPLKCTGGELSGDRCEGGTLEGGCQVDAKCDQSCDINVIARTRYSSPAVTITTSGEADKEAATKLKKALSIPLGNILVREAHFTMEAGPMPSFAAYVATLSDIRAACVPLVMTAATDASNNAVAGAKAAKDVLASVR